MSKHVLLLPGDGIGPEVIGATKHIIDWFSANTALKFTTSEALIGGAAIDATDNPLPLETLKAAQEADAVLMGSVGGPKWESMPYEKRPERGLLGIRKEMGLFANLRPALCFEALADASSIKKEIISGLDILIVRELTGDVYFGEPRGVTQEGNHRVGRNTMIYADYEVQRIARVAFDLAMKRGNKLCSVDKANVLECTEMWREEVQKIGDAEYPEVALSHMYVDNAAMQLVRNPRQFDVVVTGNMFGDILSDCAAMLTGSLGMLPSASLGEKKNDKIPAVYEPVHGSAPDIAGQNVANPLATILSFAMLLRYSFNALNEADMLELAVSNALEKGARTADIAEKGAKILNTTEMTQEVLKALDALNNKNKQTKAS